MHLTSEEYRNLVGFQKPNKHKNNKVYVYYDNYVGIGAKENSHGLVREQYDSQKEYMRHKELILLERAGKISNLKRQVPIEVFAGYTDSAGKQIKAVIYKADFCYDTIENGNNVSVIEDVKGQDKKTGKYLTTEAFRLKWKMLKARYPNKQFRLY